MQIVGVMAILMMAAGGGVPECIAPMCKVGKMRPN